MSEVISGRNRVGGETGHREEAAGTNPRKAAVSYTHLTLPTTPYV